MDTTTDNNGALKPRVRFAPSPTGVLHVGSARAALFNFLFARHTGGTYLLRIEDTDLERSTPAAVQQILDSLDWLGLSPDEPPVFQRERHPVHRAYLQRLLESGHAYRCFCPKERLEELRAEAVAAGRMFVYRRGLLAGGEMEKHEAAGQPFVVRFSVPTEGETAFDDLVYGTIRVENGAIGDFVVARGDGSPLYNFSNVVDDIDMGITHVVRGEDHVSNTSRQVLLYHALGARLPEFAHLPLILGPDKKKLSKRHGATGADEFRGQGFLPEALVNYLALLGWAPPEAEFNEVMPLEELVARFTLDRINKSPAVFDHGKLAWMNGMYLRQMPTEKLEAAVIPMLEKAHGFPAQPQLGRYSPRLEKDEWVRGVITLAVERASTLNDFADLLSYFFAAPEECDAKGMGKLLGTAEQVALLEECGRRLEAAWDAADEAANVEVWSAAVEGHIRAWSDGAGIKFGSVAQPIRLAVTGRTASPPLFPVLHYLGRAESLARIAACAGKARGLLA